MYEEPALRVLEVVPRAAAACGAPSAAVRARRDPHDEIAQLAGAKGGGWKSVRHPWAATVNGDLTPDTPKECTTAAAAPSCYKGGS